MKEQSQASDQLERDLTQEGEYQRVTISGEEKCGVRQNSFFFHVFLNHFI